MLVMVTCAVYQILTLVFKVAILSIVVACYLGVSIYQSLNESNVEPTGRWLAGVLVVFFMACLVAHSQHTEATYRSSVPFRHDAPRNLQQLANISPSTKILDSRDQSSVRSVQNSESLAANATLRIQNCVKSIEIAFRNPKVNV